MKNDHFAVKLSIPFAFLYWMIESIIHFVIFKESDFEFIPSDINELWMRCVIFILLVTFGFVVDHYTYKVFKKDCEKKDVYVSMLDATHHILNNLLNNMVLFRMEAEECKNFDKQKLERFDQIIKEASLQVENLDGIKEPGREAIEERYKPK